MTTSHAHAIFIDVLRRHAGGEYTEAEKTQLEKARHERIAELMKHVTMTPEFLREVMESKRLKAQVYVNNMTATIELLTRLQQHCASQEVKLMNVSVIRPMKIKLNKISGQVEFLGR